MTKSILLLGANSDIGQALAIKYGLQGYKVLLAGRSEDRLLSLKNDYKIRHDIESDVYSFNALDYDKHSSFYASLPDKPEITICIFGYLGDQETSENDWKEAEKIIHTNFTGAVSILNVVANDYQKSGSGTIVGISSVAGERGRASNYTYGSAKAGFTAYLSGLRNRMSQHNVHVMTVKPGFVNTRMTEHLKLPGPLTAEPIKVATAIYNGVRKKKNTLYVLWIWKWVMLIIKSIPEFIFKKMKL